MTTIITCIIVAVIAVVVTLLIAVPIVKKRAVDRKIREDADTVGTAEAKARNIIDEALKTAETKKREALLEAKEESLKTKTRWRERPESAEQNCRNTKSAFLPRKNPWTRRQTY